MTVYVEGAVVRSSGALNPRPQAMNLLQRTGKERLRWQQVQETSQGSEADVNHVYPIQHHSALFWALVQKARIADGFNAPGRWWTTRPTSVVPRQLGLPEVLNGALDDTMQTHKNLLSAVL
jgi:hypothetical protein